MRPEEDVYDHTVTYKFSLFGNLVSRISRIKKMEDKRAMEKYNQKLKMYYRCMNRRDAWYANRPTAVNLNENTSSLSPEEENEVEEVWKPSESFLGKKIRKIIDKVKDSIMQNFDFYEKDERIRWDYTWEWANFSSGSGGNWQDLIKSHNSDSLSITEKALQLLRGYLTKKHRYKFGDHFELSISPMDKDYMGWYRCIKRTNDTRHITNIFYVDVFSIIATKVVYNLLISEFNDNDDSVIEKAMAYQSTKYNLESYAKATHWTDCNRCGEGETRRSVSCFIKRINENMMNSNNGTSYLQLFSDIPCRSSLVPLEVRNKFWSIEDIEESKRCTLVCTNKSEEKTRIIEGMNEMGRKTIIDVLPPGEYQINERLPPLRKKVVRKTIVSLSKNYKDNRIFINVKHELVIRYLTMDDDKSFYSCHTPDSDVVRSFSLIVNRNQQWQEQVEYIKITIRFGAFVLIMTMVFTIVLKRTAPKKEEGIEGITAIRGFNDRMTKVRSVAKWWPNVNRMAPLHEMQNETFQQMNIPNTFALNDFQ
ncbi:unnamed protein product [Dracunculus medinensis]|uniref:Ig-like domain-containing protein n=1 Tax=Dracunculus medinensis TaxID=318479 RepID=A0A0N4U2J2_DRAME|nr:unnamed protein product [Dracunculus medinensis]